MTLPTLVLVHGAWGGAWSWRDLTGELDARSFNVVTIDLPSSTPGGSPHVYLADDARALISLTEELSGPLVLVGHSYGGAVITEAALEIAERAELAGMVYVAAIVPAPGQSVTEASRAVPVRTALDEAIGLEGDFLVLNSDRARAALYHDCEDEVAQWATERLTSQTLASFRSPRTAPDLDVPRWYISCTNDLAVDPAQQRHMAARCSGVVELFSGHTPQLSMPHTLADLIESVVQSWSSSVS